MEFSFQLTPNDWQAFQKITMQKAQQRLKSWSFGFGWNLLLWLVITLVFTILFQTFNKLDVFTAIFLMLIFFAIIVFMVIQQKRLLKALQPDNDSDIMRMNTYHLDDRGITALNDFSRSWYSWENIKEVHQDEDYLVLYLDNMRGIIFSLKELSNVEQLCALIYCKMESGHEKSDAV